MKSSEFFAQLDGNALIEEWKATAHRETEATLNGTEDVAVLDGEID